MPTKGTPVKNPGSLTIRQREAVKIARDIFYTEMTGDRVRKLTMKLYSMAMDGDLGAMKLLLDRVIPVADKLAVAQDNSITVNAIGSGPFEWMTPEFLAEREARRKALTAPVIDADVVAAGE